MGWSRRKLGREAGVGETYARDIEEYPIREYREHSLRAVATALGLEYDWLVFARGPRLLASAGEAGHEPPKGALDPTAISHGGVSENATNYRAIIPDFSPRASPRASRRTAINTEIPEREVISRAGPENHILDEAITGSWVIPARSVRDFRLQAGHASIIQVRGDSMAPTLLDGDRVLVDEMDSLVAANGIFAIFAGEGVIVKRLEPIFSAPGEPRKLRIRSDNPAYAPQEIEGDWVRVIGRVRGLIRPL